MSSSGIATHAIADGAAFLDRDHAIADDAAFLDRGSRDPENRLRWP
jgi:hypothetical protein